LEDSIPIELVSSAQPINSSQYKAKKDDWSLKDSKEHFRSRSERRLFVVSRGMCFGWWLNFKLRTSNIAKADVVFDAHNVLEMMAANGGT
jgi:hypothetical protein